MRLSLQYLADNCGAGEKHMTSNCGPQLKIALLNKMLKIVSTIRPFQLQGLMYLNFGNRVAQFVW